MIAPKCTQPPSFSTEKVKKTSRSILTLKRMTLANPDNPSLTWSSWEKISRPNSGSPLSYAHFGMANHDEKICEK